MLVESYDFGRIVVGGREYRSDVVLGDEIIVENWWRKEGHRICIEDLEWLDKVDAEVVIFGTGAYGRVKVDEEVVKLLEKRGIEVLIEQSSKAVEKFNELKKRGKKVVLAIHLTC